MSGKSNPGFETSHTPTSPNSVRPSHSTPMTAETAQETSASDNYTSNHPHLPSQRTDTKHSTLGSNPGSNPIRTPSEPPSDPERTASEPHSDPTRTVCSPHSDEGSPSPVITGPAISLPGRSWRMNCARGRLAGVASGVMLYTLILAMVLGGIPAAAATPRAGVARIDITPKEPVWMSGYAARKRPSTGVQMPIQAKALALEDGRGGRVVLVSVDIIGLSAALSDRVAAEVASKYKLERSQLVLNSSHTHTGPMVDGNLSPMAPSDEAELAKIRAYTNTLAEKLVTVIGASLGDLAPARLHFDYGEAGFAINRRKREVAPVDHRVPVLRVSAPNGQIRALLFGYACHNTTLTAEFLEISGDYAGYAQAQLEKEFPGATALFFMLCGGDQNPEPRSRRELAEKHGGELAREVARVARTPMEPVEGRLRTALQLTRLVLSNMKQVNYPVQAVRFEKGFTLITLGGEVVVDYALKFTAQYPKERLMVAGYSNDVMCYIPSLRILREGGYEGGDSMKWYNLDAPFAEDVEERVTASVAAVMERVRK